MVNGDAVARDCLRLEQGSFSVAKRQACSWGMGAT
jgi:hypothetical protein